MLIITDSILNHLLHTDIIKLGNIKLSKYIELQNNLSSHIKLAIEKYDVIVYSLGSHDESENIHHLYEKLIKGKIATYFLIPPGFSLDFAEVFEDFDDDVNTVFNINEIVNDDQSLSHNSVNVIDTNEIKDDFFDLEKDIHRYLYLKKKITYFEGKKHKYGIYIVNGKLKSHIQINEDCDYNIDKCNIRISQLNCQSEIDQREAKVQQIFDILINDKPTMIKTHNTYDRSCVYEALERYPGKIWCQRYKVLKKEIAEYPQCKKHRRSLSGGCDCCCDPFCCGPYCDMCGNYEYCRHAADVGDELYPYKATVGLNIFYEKPRFKCKEFN